MGAKLQKMVMIVGIWSVLLCGCKKEAQQSVDMPPETEVNAESQDAVETSVEEETRTENSETETESESTGIISLKDVDFKPDYWLYDEIIEDFKITDFEILENNSIILDFEFIFVDGQTLSGKQRLSQRTIDKDLKLDDFHGYSCVPELYYDWNADGDNRVKAVIGKRINHWKWTSDLGEIYIYNTLVYNEETGRWETTGDCKFVWQGENEEQQREMHIDKINKIYLSEFEDDYDGDGVTDYAYRWMKEDDSSYYSYYLEMSTAGNMQIGYAGKTPDVHVDISKADLTGDGVNEIIFYTGHWTSAYDASHINVYRYSDGEFAPFDMPISTEGHEFTIDRDMTRVSLSCEEAGFSDTYWDELYYLDATYEIYQGKVTESYKPCHSKVIDYEGLPAVRYWYYIGSKWDAIFIEEIVSYKDGVETTIAMQIDSPNSETIIMRERGDSSFQYEYLMNEENSFFYSIHKNIADSGLVFVYRLGACYDYEQLSKDRVNISVRSCAEGEWEKIEALGKQISEELGIKNVYLNKSYDFSE